MKKDFIRSSVLILSAFFIFLLLEYLFNFVFIGEKDFYKNLYIKKNILIPLQIITYAVPLVLAFIMTKRHKTNIRNMMILFIQPVIFTFIFIILFKIINVYFLECFSVFVSYFIFLIVFFVVFNLSSLFKLLSKKNGGNL